MNASVVLLCLNSACPLFSDNICVMLLWVKLNKDIEFAFLFFFFFLFKLLLGVVTVHAITPSWLLLSQVKSLLDYILWLHKMRLRGTLDICA